MSWKISSSRSDMMRCRCSTLTVLSGRPSSLVMVMRPAFRRLVHERRAVFELQFFRAAQRHFQAVGQIVGNVVAADRQHAGVLDDAVGIDDVIRRAAADVNDQRAQFLLLVRQQRERRREAVENNFLHFKLQAFHERGWSFAAGSMLP